MSAVLDAAIMTARRFPVFFCREDKRPACKNGFKDAVKDPSAVVDLWRISPGPLIGVPTGPVSGIDALDIDPRHGGDVWFTEAIDKLPVTRIHHTRSGGRHVLFRHYEGVRNTASKIAPGVDTRGDGGFIILWSAHGFQVENRETLAAWPSWLLKLLMPPKRSYPPVTVPATAEEGNTRAALMIERAFDRVRRAAPGQRHYELRAAAATLGGLSRFTNRSPEAIERDLVMLIMQTGAEDQSGAEKTARWAMTKGASSPLLARR